MRFLIDAQLPPALCGWFEERGLIAQHVSVALGGQTPDPIIATHVEQHGLILVTKDDDFCCVIRPFIPACSGSAAATSAIAGCASGSTPVGR